MQCNYESEDKRGERINEKWAEIGSIVRSLGRGLRVGGRGGRRRLLLRTERWLRD